MAGFLHQGDPMAATAPKTISSNAVELQAALGEASDRCVMLSVIASWSPTQRLQAKQWAQEVTEGSSGSLPMPEHVALSPRRATGVYDADFFASLEQEPIRDSRRK